jgi:hypothetical protein
MIEMINCDKVLSYLQNQLIYMSNFLFILICILDNILFDKYHFSYSILNS